MKVKVEKIKSGLAAYKTGFRYQMTVFVHRVREGTEIRKQLGPHFGYQGKYSRGGFIPSVLPGSHTRGWNSTGWGHTNFSNDAYRCVYDDTTYYLNLYFKDEGDAMMARMMIGE